MAIYYIRQTGNDLNNGTSPTTAWRTFTKALSSTGATSGDIVYIGAGTYRETVVVGATPTSEVQFIGDLDGIMTGDGGEVKLSSFLFNDESISSSSYLISLGGKDFLTFRNIIFITSNSIHIDGSSSSSSNIKLQNCTFLSNGASNILYITVAFGVPANWIIDGCSFYTTSNQAIFVGMTTGVGADYDANILITNCIFYGFGGSRHMLIQANGSSANEGGGIRIYNCTFLGIQGILINSNRFGGSTFMYPMEIVNCIFLAGANTAISSSEVGNIIENYNIISSAAAVSRQSVLPGPQSIIPASTSNTAAPLLEMGQSFINKMNLRPIGVPRESSFYLRKGLKMSLINSDILGATRPAGTNSFITSGLATSANLTSLSDTNRNFGTSGTLRGATLRIIEGVGAGQVKTVFNNHNNIISGDGPWINIPDNTSKYIIYNGVRGTMGAITGSTPNTISGSGVNWGTNFWQGYTCLITSGNASGQNFIISGNNTHTLSGYYPMNPAPSVGDIYSIFWGGMMAGTVTSATSTTLTDNTMTWPMFGTAPTQTGFWNNWRCMITQGVAAGSNFGISGHNTNTLTGWSPFLSTPQVGDKYLIYYQTGCITGYYNSGDYPTFNIDTLPVSVGCFENGNTAIRETGVVLSGNNTIKLFGPSYQDFYIPISGNTTISIYGQYDNYYSGIKPQLIIKDGSGIGVPDTTGTMNGSYNQWEAISVDLSPTIPGIITARLQSNTTGYFGSVYFDSFNIV